VPLDRLPFPPLVKWTLIATTLLLAVALVRSPRAFEHGIQFERAQRKFESGDYRLAVGPFTDIIERYPFARKIRVDLARAQVRSGDVNGAIETIMWFQGREVSESFGAELDELAAEIEAAATQPGGNNGP
jgi:hypothetical protein